jgi:hypothetical protein
MVIQAYYCENISEVMNMFFSLLVGEKGIDPCRDNRIFHFQQISSNEKSKLSTTNCEAMVG